MNKYVNVKQVRTGDHIRYTNKQDDFFQDTVLYIFKKFDREDVYTIVFSSKLSVAFSVFDKIEILRAA